MQAHRHWIPHGLLLAAALAATAAGPARGETYREAQERRPWYSLLRPACETPEAQLAHARALRARGRAWRARRQYRALVASWPVSAEAGAAQRELAELLDAQGRTEAAFDAYQILADRYPGQRPFREILDRQFELAEEAMTRPRYRWLFGGWATPERAVPMLEHLARAAPGWPRAAEAQFLIAEAHRKNGDWLDAVIAYQELLIRFPQCPYAEDATIHRAAALALLARDAPNDPLARDEAWTAVRHALRQYPDSARRDELHRMADELEARRIAAAWAVARYYDRHHLTPEAARLSYERFLTQYPDSPHTARAQERMKWFAERAARVRPDPTPEAPDAPVEVEEG